MRRDHTPPSRRPAVALAVCSLLAGCATAGSPAKAVLSFVEAEARGDYGEAHALLTSDDQAVRTLEAFESEHLEAGPLWLEAAERTLFRGATTSKSDDKVTVTLTATHLDLQQVQADIGGIRTEDLELAPDPEGLMRDWVSARLDGGGWKWVQESLRYEVRQEPTGWRVWLGLARLDEASDLYLAAVLSERAGSTVDAMDAWAKLLEVKPDPNGVVESLQTTARERLGP